MRSLAPRYRALIAALLMLLPMVLATGQAAVARVPSLGADGFVVEICTGASTVLVQLDGEGAPVPVGPSWCPDCLPGLAAADLAAPLPALLVLSGGKRLVPPRGASLANGGVQAALARGPPLI